MIVIIWKLSEIILFQMQYDFFLRWLNNAVFVLILPERNDDIPEIWNDVFQILIIAAWEMLTVCDGNINSVIIRPL